MVHQVWTADPPGGEDRTMSSETERWLNNMTLIGFTDKRGHAWHYRQGQQGDEPNHYPQAIPVADVRRRLFNFDFAEGTVESQYVHPVTGECLLTVDDTRKTIIRPRGAFGEGDPGAVLYVPKDGFTIHGYDRWLVQHVEDVLDASADDIGIASAGLLKDGAIAWVQFELPDSREVEGFAHRPFITAATSVNGDLSSTYLSGTQAVVCDNTLAAATSERGARTIKVKHSRHSEFKIGDVREHLEVQVQRVGDAFDAEIADLIAQPVTDRTWGTFLNTFAPVPVEKGRSRTLAESRRDTLDRLWRSDERVSPWRGTAFGVLQAVNTYNHHHKAARGSRVQRNMLNAVTGQFAKDDADALTMLNRVLASV